MRPKPQIIEHQRPEFPAPLAAIVEVTSRLEAGRLGPQLKELVSKGCDERRLLIYLAAIMKPPVSLDDWNGLVGMDKRKLKAALDRIRKCADEIERVNSADLMKMLTKYAPEYRHLLLLPRQLRLFADEIRLRTKIVRPKAHMGLSATKELLVRHVIEKTGQVHDPEVSELIAAVRPMEYSAQSHGEWRRNQGLYPSRKATPLGRQPKK